MKYKILTSPRPSRPYVNFFTSGTHIRLYTDLIVCILTSLISKH